ncbi:MAG: type II toxin-antitoxin system PemK/MazF family toxin [Rickettsiales bacterium]|nr:type II toxin-antitoxin system PemK/MazF family toxin [Rickettsiales bacterium]
MCDFELCCRKSDNTICCCDFSSNIKPEIGKIRPVLIVKPHRRHRLAIIVPFTTKKPRDEISLAFEMPQSSLPGVLRYKKCWALCDMIQVVNLDRLQGIFRQKSFEHNFIDRSLFDKIIKIIHSSIG